MSARITWLGHASFHVRLGERTVLIDPFIEGNPTSPLRGPHEIGPVDLVVVTHEHGDHGLNEAIAICKERQATLVSFYDLIQSAMAKGLPAELGVGGNIGGTVHVGEVAVTFTQAFHTCPIVGVIIRAAGFTLYYASDTGLFGDMALIGRHELDLAMLPIGDYFTMGIDDAVEAVKLLRPEAVIPMHYNTFPPIRVDPQEFVDKVGSRARVIILQPGRSVQLGEEEAPAEAAPAPPTKPVVVPPQVPEPPALSAAEAPAPVEPPAPPAGEPMAPAEPEAPPAAEPPAPVEPPAPPAPEPPEAPEEPLPLEPGQAIDLEGWDDLPDDVLAPKQ